MDFKINTFAVFKTGRQMSAKKLCNKASQSSKYMPKW